eukprot:jgi/Galph1/929/GphlegSOOS_G5622.1
MTSKPTEDGSKTKRQSSSKGQSALQILKSKGLEIVKRLQKKDSFQFFAQPVDTKFVRDYLDVIKHPMDLGTVQGKLEKQSYRNFQELWDDIQLTWSNCCTYNKPETEFYKTAVRLRKFTRRLFAALCVFLRRNGYMEQYQSLHATMKRHRGDKQTLRYSNGTFGQTAGCRETFTVDDPSTPHFCTGVPIKSGHNQASSQTQGTVDTPHSNRDWYSRLEKLASSYLFSSEDDTTETPKSSRMKQTQQLLRKHYNTYELECLSKLPLAPKAFVKAVREQLDSRITESSYQVEEYKLSLENYTKGMNATTKQIINELLKPAYNHQNVTMDSTVQEGTRNANVSKPKMEKEGYFTGLDIVGDTMESLLQYMSDPVLKEDLLQVDRSSIDYSMPYGVSLDELKQLFSLHGEYGVELDFLAELVNNTNYFLHRFSESRAQADSRQPNSMRYSSSMVTDLQRERRYSPVYPTTTNMNPREESSRDSLVSKPSEEIQARASRMNTGSDVFCMNCGTVRSPGWRAGPPNARRLCNACGLFWAKHKQHRPKEKWIK